MKAEKTKTALIVTQGCRLNTADTALLTARLRRIGWEVVEEEDAVSHPELVAVNSCAVTAEAERKCRQTLRRLRRRFPAARIVVLGCAAAVSAAAAQALRRAGADFTAGNPGKCELDALLGAAGAAEVPPRLTRGREVPRIFREGIAAEFPHRTRAFVKIQEGCDNFCTYCLVPYLRGPARSRDFDETLAECRQAVAAGFPEVVLTGVNSCAYRTPDGRGLAELIRAVAALPGEFRIRLGSTEPGLLANAGELFDTIAEEPRMCRFLHLSLQHGSDAVLRRMNRHYTAAEFAEFVARARTRIPGIHIGSDFIVGFPGESDAEFAEGLEFVRRIGFANLHIFPFSPRPGTPAATMPDRPDAATVRRRLAELHAAAAESKSAFAESQRGRELSVIFESVDETGTARGWSDNYLEVTAPAAEVELGRITLRRF